MTSDIKDAEATDAKHKIDNSSFGVLVVDDEKDILEVIRIYLQKYGFVVRAFSDPFLALEHFNSNQDAYDVLLTDIRMPGMTGMELAKNIIRSKPEIHVVFMTAFELDNDAFWSLADTSMHIIRREDVISKPFSLIEICNAIKKQLNV